MRITFIIQDLFIRGAEYATSLLVRGFLEKGYDVDLIVSKVHDDYLAEGLKPYDIPPETNVIHLKSRQARFNILELRSYLRKTDSRAVIVMGGGYGAAVPLAALGLWKCPPLFLVRHTIEFALDEKLQYRAADNSLRARLRDWWRYRAYAGVFCVAEKVRTEMIRLDHLAPEKTFTVYNPAIDAAFFEKLKRPVTHPWLKGKTMPTFVTAGAFKPEKNHLMVMKALKLANEQTPVRMIFFGTGPLKNEYEAFARENGLEDKVDFPGFSSCLPPEIAASDGYISSSQIESFGIAIVEALACGVPVIATDAPCGPREILEGVSGSYLVSPNDPEALAASLVRVKSPSSRAEGWKFGGFEDWKFGGLESWKFGASEGRGARLRGDDEAWRRFELSRIVELYEKAMSPYL